jgi:hypothetical protein
LVLVGQGLLGTAIKPDVVYCVHGIVGTARHRADHGTKRSYLLL